MRNIKKSLIARMDVFMSFVLAIDVTKGRSMVSLISSCDEVLISLDKIYHSDQDFINLLNKLKLENISVIMNLLVSIIVLSKDSF